MSDLLPPSARPLERAISETIDRPVPVIVSEVWDPDTCPVALLPWLAWAFSVDVWNSSWTEQQKRNVIKASVSVHGRKGTIGALKSALTGIGFESSVTEWHQQMPAGEPYTFEVLLTLEQSGIPDNSDYKIIEQLIGAAKNLRSHLTGIDIRARSRGLVLVGATTISGDVTTIASGD
ncbi:MAG: phage tail protein I [Pseudohongiella sp.]|nr:phage tail protein I [Pseudohongiella sp.]